METRQQVTDCHVIGHATDDSQSQQPAAGVEFDPKLSSSRSLTATNDVALQLHTSAIDDVTSGDLTSSSSVSSSSGDDGGHGSGGGSGQNARLESSMRATKQQVEQLAQQVDSRFQEAKRLSVERAAFRDMISVSRGRHKELHSAVRDLQQCIDDLRGKHKEQVAMDRLKRLEYKDMTGKLTRQVDQMTSQNNQLKTILESYTSDECHSWPRPPGCVSTNGEQPPSRIVLPLDDNLFDTVE